MHTNVCVACYVFMYACRISVCVYADVFFCLVCGCARVCVLKFVRKCVSLINKL